MKHSLYLAWLIPLTVGLLTGCERSPSGASSQPAASPGRSASGAPSAAAAFTPPDIDTARLPFAVQTKIGAARTVLRRNPEDADKTLELGALCYANGLPTPAMTCFQHLAALKPEYGEPWYYLARAAEAAGDIPAALRAYDKAATLPPSTRTSDVVAKEPYRPAILRLALLLVPKDAKRATDLFQSVVSASPEHPTAYYGLGQLARAAGKNEQAAEYFRQALECTSRYGPAHVALAELLTAQGKTAEAAEHQAVVGTSDQLIPSDPLEAGLLLVGLHLPTLLEQARSALDQRDFDLAEKQLKVARDVNAAASRSLFGLLYFNKGKYPEAAKELRAALQDDPNSVPTQANLALALAFGQDPEAEPFLQALLTAHPTDDDVLDCLCRIRRQQRRPADAVPVLRQALSLAPADADVQYRVALLLSGLGDNAAAQGALRRALELRPTHVGARYQLGLALVAANDLPGAVQAWTEVLRREPGHTSTRERLAEYHLSKRDYAAAERTLRDGLRLRPGALGLQNTLAWLLATSPESTQRRGAEAVTLAEKAVAATRRTDATTLDTLAAAYAEVGRFDDARQAIAEAIRLLMNARVPADQAQPIVETVQRYKARQQLYWANKPYHEE